MIRNYIKTSGRSLLRDKLFSSINIIGLAISMSVGLLLIAFILDLNSYDRFNTQGNRIYRITNVASFQGDPGGKYGTTSIKTGKLIREKITGVEEVTILQHDFAIDATVGDNVIPLKGYWAEPSVFSIFSFNMLEGNPETALRDPYSLVLTETAAHKLFGTASALGKVVQFNATEYQVTGVMQDVPFFSHFSFEALASFSTAEQMNRNDPRFAAWTNMFSTSVYVLLAEQASPDNIQTQLNALASEENRADETTRIQPQLLPLFNIVVGEELRRPMGRQGPHVTSTVLWVVGGLALVVVLSACFNYTNLSMARALRRFKEVGLRKAIGAGKGQIRQQFLSEAILISLAALLLSFAIFLLLRPQLIALAPEMQRLVRLELSAPMVVLFVLFAVGVGILAGVMPALFFSKVSALTALKNISTVKTLRHVSLRRALVVVQYTVTLIFITTTAIGFVQYKNILAFDLGFNTEHILNIDMQGNKPEAFLQELGELPEVTGLSRSLIVTSVGNAWGGYMKYKESNDSVLVFTNHVDENYLPLHEHKLLAGSNFIARPTSADAATEVIVNQQVLKRLHINADEPEKAIGQEVTFSSFRRPTHSMTIVGVMKDFHYGTVDNLIEPTAFMFWVPGDRAVVNARIESRDLPATLARIESTWKKFDRVHPFKAKFYDEEIAEAYSEFSTIIKTIGFLAFLAISIASMGLFGMVVFTTETRLKEISIRKVLGASEPNLIFLLSRGFLALLSVAAIVALPVTYIFFERYVLKRFPYHSPVQLPELFAGLLTVLLIAFLMIGSQTLRATRRNPATVLKSE